MNAELTSTHGTGIDNIPAMAIHGSSGTTNYYYLKDLANTVLALANSSGSIVESYFYDAYGNVTIRNGGGNVIGTSAYGNRFLFQGREYDYTTQLYHFRARWYDPETGRWLSNDPIGISGGLNLYAFCSNDPVNFVDPSGEFWDGVVYVLDCAENFTAGYVDNLSWGITSHLRSDEVDEIVCEDSFSYTAGSMFTPRGLAKMILRKAAVSGAGKLVSMASGRALQKGGHTINKNTANQLGLERRKAGDALEKLKIENGVPKDFHGNIMSNGDYVNPKTGGDHWKYKRLYAKYKINKNKHRNYVFYKMRILYFFF